MFVKSLVRLALIVFCLLFVQVGTSHAVNRVFLLDKSSSMRSSGLFDRIKADMLRNYVSQMVPGEHIAVLAFDEEVVLAVDRQVKDESDKNDIVRAVNALRADGQWTWMKEALSLTAEQARGIRARYPDDKLLVYILTDGVNDPPPGHREDAGDFNNLLRDFFDDVQMENDNVYVLVFNEDSTLVDLKPFGGISQTPGTDTPFPAEVIFEGSGFAFGTIYRADLPERRSGKLRVAQLTGTAAGPVVDIDCVTDAGRSLDATPSQFRITTVGQQIEVGITLPSDLEPKSYNISLRLSSSEVKVQPRVIPVTFQVVRPTDYKMPSWLQTLSLILLALAALYLLIILMHTKELRLENDDTGKEQMVTVKHTKKISLEEMGLPDCYLGLGNSPWNLFTVFFRSKQGDQQAVTDGEPITGEDFNITTYVDSKSVDYDAEDYDSTEDDDPDFFKKDSYDD